MRNHIISILFALLLIAGVVIYLLIRERSIAQRDRNLGEREWRKKSDEWQAVIAERGGQISTLLSEKDSIIERHGNEQRRFKRQANASRARITGPPVVQDTVIIYLDSLVADLESEKDTVYVRNDAIIDSLNRQVSDISELFQGQLKQSMKMEGELEREKKKRWSFGPHVGYGFRGADVGISIQYSIFRF